MRTADIIERLYHLQELTDRVLDTVHFHRHHRSAKNVKLELPNQISPIKFIQCITHCEILILLALEHQDGESMARFGKTYLEP